MRMTRHDFATRSMFQWIRDLCETYPYTHVLSSFEHCQTFVCKDDESVPSIDIEVRTIFDLIEQEMGTRLMNTEEETPMERCLQSLETLSHLRQKYRPVYNMYVDIMYELHPAIHDIRRTILEELVVLRHVHSAINGTLNFIHTYENYIMIPSAKVEASKYECGTFLKKFRDHLADVPVILNEHSRLMLSSVSRNEGQVVACLGECFQDIYFLEALVHSSHIPSSVRKNYYIHYSSVRLLEKVYQTMYDRIVDGHTWTVMLTNENGDPMIKMHPYLPHPEDFVFMERPWKNILRRRSIKFGSSRILYAAAPLPINRFMTRKLMSLL